MIGHNFIYCRPEKEQEAVDLYMRFRHEGKIAMYYAGGSEIITMCTAGSIKPDAVIDIKNIPALNIMKEIDGRLFFGAACTLDSIRTSRLFPLLGECGGRVADHTNQCRITIGGNICGTIIYREATLPLLLADAELELFGSNGRRTVTIHDVFNGRIRLFPGEFIVSVCVDSAIAKLPYAHIKRTFTDKIAYPAVTIAAILMDNTIRIALSGICSFPFRGLQMEKVLNERRVPLSKRIEHALSLLPETPQTDAEGSGAYRAHLMQLMLTEIITSFESKGHCQ